MLDIAIDGRLQITAGLALLETSKLVEWEWDAERFGSETRGDFECALKHFHPVFGRVICWIIFSTGAEFLAKGVCLLHGIRIRAQDCVPAYPTPDVATWLETFQNGSPGTLPITNFGAIGNLYNGHLQSLCQRVGATKNEQRRLLAAYELLRRTIRNRDAHAYVPKKRDSHFYLVRELFIPAVNDLLLWTRLPAGELNKWRKEAQQFIDSDLTIDHDLDKSLCDKVAASKKERKQKMQRISQRLDTYSEGELDGVILFLDQLGASMDEEDLELAEQGMSDYASALADEDAR